MRTNNTYSTLLSMRGETVTLLSNIGRIVATGKLKKLKEGGFSIDKYVFLICDVQTANRQTAEIRLD